MPSQFNELIQSKSIASITPQQILDAGEPVFFDIQTSPDITAINKLIQAYGRIHAPTYGQPIPQSGLVSSLVGAGDVLEPSLNQIRKVFAVSITNAGGAAPIVGTLTLGGMFLANFAADPSSTTGITIPAGIFSSKNLSIAVTVSAGTASDLTTDVASLMVVQ
jgi:hypothetical protein